MMGRLELLIGVLLILNASFRYLMWALLNLSIHAYFLHYIFSGRYMNMYYGIKKRDQINTYMDGDQYVHGWRSICTWMEINTYMDGDQYVHGWRSIRTWMVINTYMDGDQYVHGWRSMLDPENHYTEDLPLVQF